GETCMVATAINPARTRTGYFHAGRRHPDAELARARARGIDRGRHHAGFPVVAREDHTPFDEPGYSRNTPSPSVFWQPCPTRGMSPLPSSERPPMIPFIDLQSQRQRLGQPLEDAILKVVRSGAYIMGPEIAEFERQLAAFGQAPFALSCGSGTEALVLPLMAWGIGPGDAVFCPAFTFAATAEAMPLVGASPVFVDVLPDTYNIDPAGLDAAIAAVKAEGKLTPRAVIAVDLFGQPADYPAIAAVCAKHGLKLIADSAQGFGCTLSGKHPIHWADVATTSFFPAKPL